SGPQLRFQTIEFPGGAQARELLPQDSESGCLARSYEPIGPRNWSDQQPWPHAAAASPTLFVVFIGSNPSERGLHGIADNTGGYALETGILEVRKGSKRCSWIRATDVVAHQGSRTT